MPILKNISKYPLALKINKLHSNAYLTEKRILSRLQSSKYHVNICKFLCFGFDRESARLHQIFEYYANGTLESFIVHQRKQGSDGLNYRQMMQIIIQICNGLIHIHKNEIVHLDIKPANIFIHFNPKKPKVYLLKIGDFGISADLLSECAGENKCLRPRLQSGDPVYIAPEILDFNFNFENKENVKKIDVYSLGIIGLEMLFDCNLPSQGALFAYLRNIKLNSGEIEWHRFERSHPLRHSLLKDRVKKILHRMLVQNPSERLSAIGLLENIQTIWENDGDSYKRFLRESFDQLLKCKTSAMEMEIDRSAEHLIKDLYVFDVDMSQTFEPAAAGYRDFVDFTLEHSREQLNTAFLFA